MVNRHRSNWSQMGSSKFEFNNNLDERIQQREIIYKQFKERLINDYKKLVLEFSGNQDLVRTDSLIETGLRYLYEEFMD